MAHAMQVLGLVLCGMVFVHAIHKDDPSSGMGVLFIGVTILTTILFH